ncbi:MAG: alanine racemase, partial [Sneathiella sp.]|nr:alanine racemase [Sneathiella sp.]
VPSKLNRVKALQEAGATLTLLLDTLVTAKQISEAGRKLGTTFPCFIEIDCDGKRAGLKPDDNAVLTIAKHLDEAQGASLSGVMTHSGGSYYCNTRDEIFEAAEQERKAITQAATAIRAQNINCPVVSAGSTPTATYTHSTNGITEIRAGVFVFQDMVMQALGVCQTDDIAISVLSSVISHNPAHNRLLIDAGSLALSADPGKKNNRGQSHFGQVCKPNTAEVLDGLFVTSTNQEHGLISLEGTAYALEDFPIGSQLRILPNHVCITAAAYTGYHVIGSDTGEISAYWPRHNGW